MATENYYYPEPFLEEYETDNDSPETESKYLIVVIFDIPNNKRRTRLGKFLKGYGYRVQRSSFECILGRRLYEKLCREIPRYIDPNEDLLKIYKVYGKTHVMTWGTSDSPEPDDVIVL